MPLPERRWLGHQTPDWIRSENEIFFVTVCAAVRGSKEFVKPDTAAGLIESVAHRHASGVWWAHLFVVMPDHVHGLFSFPRTGAGLNQTVAAWKRWTAKSWAISWQKGFFDHRLRGDEGLVEKAHYVRMNPVRAGLVARPEDWPHVWTPR